MRVVASWLLGLCLLAGCAGGGVVDGVYRDTTHGVEVRLPGAGWNRLDLEGATLAFRSPAIQAGMALRLECAAPEPGELLWVARHLFFGFQDKRVLHQEPVAVRDAAGLRTRLRARLDGAPVEVEGVTLRRGGCLADFLYVASPERFAAGYADFEAVVQSLASSDRP